MQISTILDHIDSGHIALPEFQRGYVWNRNQVKNLFDSLYKRHPVGGLLVWVTESEGAPSRGDGALAPGVVKLLLDGQQRITSLYGISRGKAPEFFDGDESAFTGLYFHLNDEAFSFYQPLIMKDDDLWIDVSALMISGNDGLGAFINKISSDNRYSNLIGDFIGRLSKLLGILAIDLHIEEVTGRDKTLDIVVDIFNRVNSGGTKLSKGDLALAKICSEWTGARNEMQRLLSKWEKAGYKFNLDWLLRSVNTILTGEAKFQYLHEKSTEDVKEALIKAEKYIDVCLNLIGGRLGLDHDQVFFSRFAIPVMVRYLENHNTTLNKEERDKLLFWFIQVGMWGRFSGSVESNIDKDLEAFEGPDGGLDKLIDQLRSWRGGLSVYPENFSGWSRGARFYPVLYMLSRVGEAKDLFTGIPLKADLLGRMNKLEVHHIFPKAQLYKYGYKKDEVNALANYCFITKETNLHISDSLPEEYLAEILISQPGVLESQWIPTDPMLWKIENYHQFIEARKKLLADKLNLFLLTLFQDSDTHSSETNIQFDDISNVIGGVDNIQEEELLLNLNVWMEEQNLPLGIFAYDYADAETGDQKAIFDLAWPNGIQEELSVPVAVLLNEPPNVISMASQAGFRCFTSENDFKRYISDEILGLDENSK